LQRYVDRIVTHITNRSQKHADTLVHSRSHYGEAIICYGRSRRVDKLKELAGNLVNFSLVQSSPYPSESETDLAFNALTLSPQSAIDYANEAGDAETAYHFVSTFGGYCALRNYYRLRDGEPADGMDVDGNESDVTERLKKASAALVELVNAAVDSVRDEDSKEADGLIPVEALLALLGEVLGFVTSKFHEQSSTSANC
jgi:hypothetical protein